MNPCHVEVSQHVGRDFWCGDEHSWGRSPGVQRDSALLGAACGRAGFFVKSMCDKACPLLRVVLMDGGFWCGDARRARFCGRRDFGMFPFSSIALSNDALRSSLHRAAGVCINTQQLTSTIQFIPQL